MQLFTFAQIRTSLVVGLLESGLIAWKWIIPVGVN